MDIVVVLEDLPGNLVARRVELQRITTLLLTGVMVGDPALVMEVVMSDYPDDEFEGGQRRGTQFGNDDIIMNNNIHIHPQIHSFTFQSSTITYGASNGAYHISSTTRRTGSDRLRFEEYKEADPVTREAAHRLSRGIHDKGHTLTRNLKSDVKLDTMQVLHNISADEVDRFEEAWKGKARKHLPG